MRNLVFDYSSNPVTDEPIYKLSGARADEMVKSGQAHRLDCRRIQKFAPKDTSEEELLEFPGDSKAALTQDDMQANVGIGGEFGQPCPKSVIRRAQQRIKGWNDGRSQAQSGNSRRISRDSRAFAGPLLAVPAGVGL